MVSWGEEEGEAWLAGGGGGRGMVSWGRRRERNG